MREHAARITWATRAERGLHALPSTLQYVRPAHFAEQRPGEDLWSVVCRFDVPPSEQGNPSNGHVRFLMSEAPHEWLHPGTTFRISEGIVEVASVAVLD